MKRTIFCLTTLLLACAVPIQAIPASAASYIFEGIGARPLGMGRAYVAVASDATAGYWNPAGLTQLGITANCIAAETSIQTLGRSMNHLGYARQTDEWGSFAVNWINAGVSEIEMVNTAGRVTGNTADMENAYLFSYANTMEYIFRWGTTVKLLQQSVAGASALGYGLDLGAQVQPWLSESFWLGMNVQNIGGKLVWSTGWSDPVLLNIKMGAAYLTLDDQLLLAVDADRMDKDNTLRLHTGAEGKVMDSLWVRGGWDDGQWTAGASYAFSIIYELDYVFLYNRDDLGDAHHISMLVKF